MKYWFMLVLLLAVACDGGDRDWDDDSDDDDESGGAACTQEDIDDCADDLSECIEHHPAASCGAKQCDCLAYAECYDEWEQRDCEMYN